MFDFGCLMFGLMTLEEGNDNMNLVEMTMDKK